jgi:hypothetical protein
MSRIATKNIDGERELGYELGITVYGKSRTRKFANDAVL